MPSLVLIIPAALRAEANALGAALGHGPDSYSVALSADGLEPATHYGLNFVDPAPAFLDMIEQGSPPPDLDFSPGDFAAVMAGLIAETGDFASVTAACGLQPITTSG